MFTLHRLLAVTAAVGLVVAPAIADDKPKPAKVSHTPAKPDVLKTAATAGTFKTLLSLLVAADLTDALRADGPFTVFAPTDEAFAKLPKGTLEKLLQPDGKAELVRVLKYHVVAGKVSAKQLVADGRAKTLQGGAVTADISGGRVRVNKAAVLSSDVAADNGVIHVIDQVLTPTH